MPEAIPQYLREFPDFGLLDVALPEGFEDQSHHESTCPSFALAADDTDATGVFRLTLSIDYADPSKREFDEPGRFRLYEGEISHQTCVVLTDDWTDVLQFIQTYRQADADKHSVSPRA